MLDQSASTFYVLLNAQNPNIATFSMQVADVLGLPSSFFLKEELDLSSTITYGNITIPKNELSSEGIKDVKQLIQLCNIFAIYSTDY